MDICNENIIINNESECEDISKKNKIKIANGLVKNFCLLKELDLLTIIKNEEENKKNFTNKNISCNIENIICANKHILDFIFLKERNDLKIKEKEKKKTINQYIEEDILKEKDILNIISTLNKNELNISMYENKIKNCDELNNFKPFNNTLLINYIDIPPALNNPNSSSKFHQILKLLIKNYNNSLNIIKIQQNTINDLIFYAHNLLINNKMLIDKNGKLVKIASSIHTELKTHIPNNNNAEIKLPITDQENASYLFKTQIDLYRKHIHYLYNENNELKKMLSTLGTEKKIYNK
ncbi:conserved Plasmodium protein, unknown function [Plasmodium berghei]|uniref:Uncharacterized protein n=2 Tax=Plasmodium berghei TaxID=5821 RepID=A0A509ANZ9_PLABA|nr:conserved Plasmodium protein, unknown function [Plasmodium berghei ANKA]CXI99422.1 conserved Plasmodium protein, unknown function [Plasmodium berghei]SCL97868.1 conserved Plasmodium protein, unknown function [Plasmodium berghei]SCM16699.1 conserved Plasmodium protein, unknown function [Plasmodium berghei]SCM18497.1 conserved Plasmodium protein, unknown function [Plasmodium berghei]SCN27930.1 conserved Plasmodium protein, unknown function [Plasmodium berghei]|eukprot:XP_034423583.1 conserved Plasmodium protein, unknown function [Plasmodium berghei ANKA]